MAQLLLVHLLANLLADPGYEPFNLVGVGIRVEEVRLGDSARQLLT